MLVVVRALYGLKSAGLSWRAALAEVLAGLGFESTRADPNVWIRAAARSDGHKYYETLFVYVDDILAVSHKAKEVIEEVTAFTRRTKVASRSRTSILKRTLRKFRHPMDVRFGPHHLVNMSRMRSRRLRDCSMKTVNGTF